MAMSEPFPVPVGLRLTTAARVVERAFEQVLAAADGSLPVWLILLNLKVRRPDNQRELAEAVGIREATLTHHLTALENRGLIARTRDAANRRVQVVALTPAGDAAFLRLREAAMAFDARLRSGMTQTDLTSLAELLDRLTANVSGSGPTAASRGSETSFPAPR
jgi:MarR family transcriptional regulator, transcriptional regulator for hemolysin